MEVSGVPKIKPVFVATPPALTDTVPEFPDPTTAVICVELTTTKEKALVPPKLTDEVLVKLVPMMVTVCPV